MTKKNNPSPCICHSGESFSTCCEPFIKGDTPPATAVELMRSRFSAYVLRDLSYLTRTWSAKSQPNAVDILGEPVKWLSLQILSTVDGKKEDQNGAVEFEATYIESETLCTLREVSLFEKKDGNWLYAVGKPNFSKEPIRRSAKCPCGSGLKAKRCCLGK